MTIKKYLSPFFIRYHASMVFLPLFLPFKTISSYKMDNSSTTASYKMSQSDSVKDVPLQRASYKMALPAKNVQDEGGAGFLGRITGGLINTDRAHTIQSVKIENSTDHDLVLVKSDTALFEASILSEKGPTDAIIIPAKTKEFILSQNIRDENKPEVYEYIAFFVFDDEPIEVCRFLFGIDCNTEIMHMEIPQHYNNQNEKDKTFFIERFDKLPQEGECGLLKENKTPDSMFPRLRHKELFTSWGAYHRNFRDTPYSTSNGSVFNIGVMGIYLMADAHWIGVYFRDITKKDQNENITKKN